MDCLFCKIIKREIPSYTIYEDDVVKVFLDINPDSNGHVLIIPKEHTLDFLSISDVTLQHINMVAKIIIPKLMNLLNANGITLVQNNGDVQEVKHFHLHLKPYYNKKEEIKPVEEIYELLKQGF